MLRLLRFCLWLAARAVLALRYRVTVRGWEKLDGLSGPILVLPNHPAYSDPPVVLTLLWRRLRPRPMMYASNFENPVLYPLMKLLNALEVPDTEKASRRARKQAEEAVRKLVEGLKAGENFIMWPAGRVQRQGREVLGGARALSDILRASPDSAVLLVRTKGLWGSMFSYAQTGKAPSLLGNLFTAVGYLLANLFFFMPRRHVEITLEPLDRSQLPPGLDRRAVNQWFEDWYNRDYQTEPVYVPYHFLSRRRTFDWPKLGGGEGVDLAKVRPEVRAEVNEMLTRKLRRELTDADTQPDVTLDSLGLDSLDRMDLNQRVEQRFGFHGDELPNTVGEVYALAAGQARRSEPKPTPPLWFRPPSDTGPVTFLADTIPEAFVARALACRKDIAVSDDLAGVLTYERLLVGALTLSKRLAKLPGTNVGLLLPASAGCDMAFMALQLAGKLPVVLNWTTGQGNLEHAARLMGLRHVVTSEAFLDRIDLADLPGVEWTYLEDLRKDTGKVELLKTLMRVRWAPGGVRRRTPRPSSDQPAVVLFTSGSEKAPKAVPLTHRNLLTDLRGPVEMMRLTRGGSVLGFLPAFHSFGMSVTGLLPLLGGLRVARHADPTDAGGLVRKVAAYKLTLMAATPTFYSYMLDRATGDELASLDLVVVGAEKCPPAVFERSRAAAPKAKVLEGYGITECSPVVSVNVPETPRPGSMGKPLPRVAVCVVEVDADREPPAGDRELPPGEQGMLLVSGPTVFPGYIGPDAPDPFTHRGGKRWYVTGDLVKRDAEGYLWFAGRLKRFLKAGGEMISLPALEEPFAREFPPDKEGPRVAVEGVEMDHDRKIVLFTKVPLTLSEANERLEREGFRGVMRLTEVRRVPSIPVLGTGKTDYKVLRAQLTG
jgi:acyl-CoA synthetase (AMP-forming)/AMP-acid ligase II/1-acyl-sn-glycerol-3-phosphate acyltransferase/acyl carrier protein